MINWYIITQGRNIGNLVFDFISICKDINEKHSCKQYKYQIRVFICLHPNFSVNSEKG